MKLNIFLLLNFFYISLVRGDTCPFNEKECTCTPLTPNVPAKYESVECVASSGFPKFTSTSGQKYTIQDTLYIYGQVDVIPANAFSIFESINQLSLLSETSTFQKWNDQAFAGVKIKTFETQGLMGVIPPPKALATSVTTLKLSDGGSISLPADSFPQFKFLTHLIFSNTNITKINPNVFSSVKNNLINLEFDDTSLQECPKVLNQLPNLEKLNLKNNNIKFIPNQAFASLTKLKEIDLSDTQLTRIDLSIFPNVNKFVGHVDDGLSLKKLTVSDITKVSNTANISITDTGLETIDKSLNNLLKQNPNIFLDLSGNLFLKCDGLEWLKSYISPPQIKIDGSLCTDNGMLLADYLKGFGTSAGPSTVTTVGTVTDAIVTTVTTDGTVTTAKKSIGTTASFNRMVITAFGISLMRFIF